MNHRNLTIAKIALLALLAAVPSLVFSMGRGERNSGPDAGQAGGTQATASNPQALAEATKNLASIQYSFREVAKKVLPVVVEVDVTEQMSKSSQVQNPFDWFFNQPPGNNRGGKPPIRQGLGSGIIVRKTGSTYYVLTNNHVVDGATDISVKLDSQQVFKAKVVGTPDPRKDLAIVSFSSGADLAVADLGDSGELQVGDLVLAVGNPYGF